MTNTRCPALEQESSSRSCLIVESSILHLSSLFKIFCVNACTCLTTSTNLISEVISTYIDIERVLAANFEVSSTRKTGDWLYSNSLTLKKQSDTDFWQLAVNLHLYIIIVTFFSNVFFCGLLIHCMIGLYIRIKLQMLFPL